MTVNLPLRVITGSPEIVFKSLEHEQESGRKWQMDMILKCFLLANLLYGLMSESAGNFYIFFPKNFPSVH